MEKIFSVITDGLIFIVEILLLIGFHELGHLLTGKLAKIPIDKFSIGFGPAIIKWKGGPTVYQLSIIPLGGYVKYKGEDFDDPEGLYAFPYWRKTFTTIGGVIANFILAILAYLLMGLIYGVSSPAPVLNFSPDHLVLAKNFEPGDSLISINGKQIETFSDIYAFRNNDEDLTVEVKRPEKRLLVQLPQEIDGRIIGSSLTGDMELGSQIDSALITAGLRPGDRIMEVNGSYVETRDQLMSYPTDSLGSTLLINRPGQRLKLKTTGTELAATEPMLSNQVGRVIGKTPADSAGLKEGDRIIAIDGKPVNFWTDFSEVVYQADTTEPEPVDLVWVRGTDTLQASVTPQFMSVSGAPGLGLLAYTPSRNLTFFEALWLPVRRTGEVSAQIVVALTRIIIGKEKFTQLGGVISVARISSQIRQWGFDFILGLFASLSITLAIINLLPIPALDGGRILMFTIEKIRRKRFGKRAWTIAVNIGFIIVIALVALTLLNDIFFRS